MDTLHNEMAEAYFNDNEDVILSNWQAIKEWWDNAISRGYLPTGTRVIGDHRSNHVGTVLLWDEEETVVEWDFGNIISEPTHLLRKVHVE